MSIQEILLGGGGVLLFVMSVVQIAPIEIKPWSAIARALGRAINAEVLRDLKTVKQDLADHIRMDDERNADEHGPVFFGSTMNCSGTSRTRRRSSSTCLPTSTSTSGIVMSTRVTKITERNTLSPISAGSTMTGSGSTTF